MSPSSLSKNKNLLTGKKDHDKVHATTGTEVLFTTPSYQQPIANYSFTSDSQKTTLTVFNHGQPISTIRLHSLCFKIDIVLHGEPFSPKKDSMALSEKYNFTSAGRRYEKLSWKLKGRGLGTSKDWKLVNSEWFQLATWRGKMMQEASGAGKSRVVEFLIEPEIALLDTIMITSIAVSEMKRLEDKEGEVVAKLCSALVGA